MISFINTFLATIKKITRYGVPSHILFFGDSLGDNLLLTTLAEALQQRGYKNIWIKCNHPELFEQNPAIKLVIPFSTLLSVRLLKILKTRLISPFYTRYNEDTDRDLIPEKHIILKMADCINIKGAIVNKPVLNLTAAESTYGQFSPAQIVIVTATSGAKVPMRNKEWYIERYQQIVDRFTPAYQFIQLGTPNDLPLTNVLDLRGKTTIRQSAAVLKSSMLLITHVGFMMHLAMAVDCRAVIIYGGREKPPQSGYRCFNNLYTDVECSPCWLHNKCDYQKKCMNAITADEVAAAIRQELSLCNIPLTADVLHND